MGKKRGRDENEEVVDQRKSKRKRQPPKAELYIDTIAGPANPKNNIKWAQVVMGMAIPYSKNSNTSGAKKVNNQVKALNLEYGSTYTFIIGHLINEQFPHYNTDANFVPLTSQANTDHKNNIEKPIVNFLTAMNGPMGDPYNRALDAKGSLFFGIRYRVESSGAVWAKTKPDCFVNNFITWEVELGIFDLKGKPKNPDKEEQKTLDKLRELADNYIPGFKSKKIVRGQVNNEQQK